MLKQMRTAIVMLLLFTALTGFVYPTAVSVVGFGLFTEQSKGSLIKVDGKVVGSSLIGHPFDTPKYFWGRPSATGSTYYNAAASSGSNLSTGNPAQQELIAQRAKQLHELDPENRRPIPVDLVTASGSGLDPHISPEAAHYQCERVARARQMDAYELHRMIDRATEGRQFGILGKPRVNVLQLNLALDFPSDKRLRHSWKDPM